MAVALKRYPPSPRVVPNVKVQAPPAPEVVVPREVGPLNTCIVRPDSPEVPDIEDIAVFLIPAVGEVILGAAGIVVSTVKLNVPL